MSPGSAVELLSSRSAKTAVGVAKMSSAGHKNSGHTAGERRMPTQDDADDIVLRIMTVAEESGALTDDSQELLWQVLTGEW